MMSLSESTGQRIAILRPLLIFGILYVHTGGVSDSIGWEWANPFEYFIAVFRDGLFRASVPMLTLISGYLLFGARLDQSPVKMFRKKFRTLAIPFLAFNLAFIAVMLPMEAYFGFTHRVFLIGADTWGWLNRVFSLTENPYNYPLYFLRDMIVLVALAPLFGWFLRKAPVVGLFAVSLIFYFDADSYLVLRNTSAILFYAGGMAAVQRWNVHALDPYAKPLALLIITAYLALIAVRAQDRLWLSLGIPFLIWPASSLLQGTWIAKMALKYNKYSFFVFVAHAPLMFFLWEFVLRHARFIPFPIYYVLAPIVVIVFLIGVYNAAMRYCPMGFNFVIGNRDKKTAPSEMNVAGGVDTEVILDRTTSP